MRTRNHHCRSVVFREGWEHVARVGRIVPLVFAFLVGTAAQERDAPLHEGATTVAEAGRCRSEDRWHMEAPAEGWGLGVGDSS
jgi:hypothetical protein